MAFDKITLFEFDLQDAQFGPKSMDVPDKFSGTVGTDEDDEGHEGDVEAEFETEDSSGGPSIGRMILFAVVMSVVATLVARRLGGDDEEEETTQIEFEEDEETAPEIGA